MDAASDGGVTASLIGEDIETFTAVVTDKTVADIQTSPTDNIGNQPLPLRIPPAGGSHRIKVTLPADELLNPESLEIRIGWQLKKKNAEGAAVDITMLDGIVPTDGTYCVRKLETIINNKTQYRTSVIRDYGPETCRLDILRGIGSTVDDLERAYKKYNGFVPNAQTYAENVAGTFQAYTVAGDFITGITDYKPTVRESMTNYCLALQERNISKLVEGKEVFNILETEKEGILGATKLYPGVITEFYL